MALIPENKILEIMRRIADEFLIPRFEELEMNATGEWRDNVDVRAETNKGFVVGRHYSYYLEKGRKPGKRPPISAIKRWVEAKFGIGGDEATRAAFAVANKIAAEGTSWRNNRDQLISVLKSKEVADFVRQEFAREARVRILNEIVFEF